MEYTASMSNWSVGARIAFTFVIVVSLTAILGGFAVWELRHGQAAIHNVAVDAVPGLETSAAIQTALLRHYSLIVQRALTTDPSGLAQLDKQIETAAATLTS